MLHFIRHAKSGFNRVSDELLEKYGPNYRDTQEYLTNKFSHVYLDVQTTEEGIQQAEKARQIVKDFEVDIVLVSPMRRALRTCAIIFQNHPKKPEVIVQPIFRQIMQSSNDIGSKIEESMQLFSWFNFEKIADREAWYVQTLSNERDRTQILNKLNGLYGIDRGDAAIEECLKLSKQNWFQRIKEPSEDEVLKARILPDFNQQKKVIESYAQKYKNIVVVTHSEVLRRLAGHHMDNCEIFSIPYHQFK